MVLGSTGGVAQAATLDIPAPQTTLSGIGVISGWKCEAGELTIRFNDGPSLPLLHGAERKDVLDAGACPHANVGFVSIMNWGNLGDGYHTAVVYDDGVEFARSRFRVVMPREAFTSAHVSGTCVSEDFPEPGDESLFAWNRATQHMELVEVREWYDDTTAPRYPASTDLDFLLDRDTWTIEVPDLQAWQAISQYENPAYQEFIESGRHGGINRYVAGPADVQFIRYIHGATSNKIYPFSAIPPWGISLVGEMQGTKVSGTDRLGNVILRPALRKLVEIGTLANGLPLRTREAIGELGEAYSLVVPIAVYTTTSTQNNRCYVLVFDDFRQPPDGGLETLARFYITTRTPYVRGEPRLCVPPIYRGGANGQAVSQVSTPSDTTRVLIYPSNY